MIDYTLPLDQLPDPLPIEPLRKPFDVTITPPGSKSITCRAYVLAALAEGESKIIRPLRADDTDHLLNALCTLGAEARWDGEDVYIKGVAGRFPRGGNLYMGDGGAPTRFMIACACLAKEPVVIDASPRMRERPIAEGVDMLRQLGAKIEYVEEEGRMPVAVTPTMRELGGLVKISITSSSQFISAMLLIGSNLQQRCVLDYTGPITSEPYVAMTYRMLQDWQAHVRIASPPSGSPMRHEVTPLTLEAITYRIEPDASSATYWWLAAAINPSSRIRISGLSDRSFQPDAQFINFVDTRLYDEDRSSDYRQDPEIVVGDQERRKPSNSSSVDMSRTPDGAMALAVYLTMVNLPESLWDIPQYRERQLTHGYRPLKTRMTGLRTLRVKETDRIAALASELRKVGCTVETGEDWISIEPPASNNKGGVVPADRLEPRGAAPTVSTPRGSAGAVPRHPEKSVIIETYNDHRMAMAFAILGLVHPGISIRNPACVKKSYPGFWKDFAKLYQ